jgi:hypothetical protein
MAKAKIQHLVIIIASISLVLVIVGYAVKSISSVSPSFYEGNSTVPTTLAEVVPNPPILVPIAIILVISGGILITLKNKYLFLKPAQIAILWATIGMIVAICLFPTMRIHLYYDHSGTHVSETYSSYKPVFMSSAKFFDETGIGKLKTILNAQVRLSFDRRRFLMPILILSSIAALLIFFFRTKRA